jgi:hypothetical protein
VIPSYHGFKQILKLEQVPYLTVFERLLSFPDTFVNYCTLLILDSLCESVTNPRNVEQEQKNKSTLLTPVILRQMVMMLSSDKDKMARADADRYQLLESKEEGEGEEEEEKKGEEGGGGEEKQPLRRRSLTRKLVRKSKQLAPTASKAEEGEDDEYYDEDEEKEEVVYPNSLVISMVAQLIENLLGSRRDTSPDAAVAFVMEFLVQNISVLVFMLRSSCPIITENAAIITHILVRSEDRALPLIRESTLSEGLVLRHLYMAIFSPSTNQRYVSRFLLGNWLEGDPLSPPKLLLKRVFPPGLIEFLKFEPIAKEQELNLDMIEEEFYAQLSQRGSQEQVSQALDPNAIRLRSRLENIQWQLKQAALIEYERRMKEYEEKMRKYQEQQRQRQQEQARLAQQQQQNPPQHPPHPQQQRRPSQQQQQGQQGGPPKRPSMSSVTSFEPSNLNIPFGHTENFRVFFHMITNEHNLADLIWNEQTRLELRDALERELASLDREQQLKGPGRVAWNY